MSASSLWVTCGMFSHERCSAGPEIFLIRLISTSSTGPNFEKSTAGIGGMPMPPCAAPPAAAGAAWRLAAPAARPRAGCGPCGPVPLTLARSTSEPAGEGADRGRGMDLAEARVGDAGGRARAAVRRGAMAVALPPLAAALSPPDPAPRSLLGVLRRRPPASRRPSPRPSPPRQAPRHRPRRPPPEAGSPCPRETLSPSFRP